MSSIAPYAYFNNTLLPHHDATLNVSSASVLYGLSVYTVCCLTYTNDGFLAFRLDNHIRRLKDSAKIIGLTIDEQSTQILNNLPIILAELLSKNSSNTDQLARITLHTVDNLPGIKTNNLRLAVSAFLYDAKPILPTTGAKIKTSSWRRVTDYSIPARAKVNGAYVNSALARQEALDAGCDDALLLNQNGYVAELSAANVFLVKDGALITPDLSSDILPGITRQTIIDIAIQESVPVIERKVALTELYTADEVFACGTSTGIASITEIDGRTIGNSKQLMADVLRAKFLRLQTDQSDVYTQLI